MEKLREFEEKLNNEEELEEKFHLINNFIIYDGMRYPNKALEYAEMQLDIAKKLNDKNMESNAFNNLGILFGQKNEYEKSLENLFNAIRINEELGNQLHISHSYINVARAYFQLMDYEKALDYLQKSYKMKMELKDPGFFRIFNNIGVIYLRIGEYDKAIEYFNQYYENCPEKEDERVKLAYFNNLANAYTKKENYEKALEYHFKVLVYREQDDYLFGRVSCYLNIANSYLGMKDLENTELFLEKTELILDRNNENLEKDLILTYYEAKVNFYLAKENYKKAFEFSKKIISLKDSVFTENLNDKIAKLQFEYEQEKQAREAEIYRLKNIELEEKNKLLQESEGALKELNHTKDKLFSIIAHDVRNPFSYILGATEFLLVSFDRFDRPAIKEKIEQLFKSSNKVYDLFENLLNWSRVQLGKIEVNRSKVNINDIFREVLALYESAIESKKIDLIYDVSDGYYIWGDSNMIRSVFRNLVSNAVKFTSRGKLSIKAYKNEEKQIIEISDSGIGMQQADLENIFKFEKNISRKGTNSEEGSGLGLVLCKEFIEKQDGKIFVESAEGKGTKFSIFLPIFKE